jgi:pimeloyl-ACP methyl ester carboxylesterase
MHGRTRILVLIAHGLARRRALVRNSLLIFLLGAAGLLHAADHTTPVAGGHISYEVHGAGRPLVFVHGWSCDRTYWRDQVKEFAKRHRVVAIDLAGHGDSSVKRNDWTMSSFGGDVASVIEALDLNDVVLVGHSMGGDVIVEAARRLPGRITGLVWVDVYKELGEKREFDVAAFVAPFETDFAGTTRQFVRKMFAASSSRSLVDRISEDMSRAPRDVALPAMRSALTHEPQVLVALAELKLPVIAINPEVPASNEASLARHGVRVVTVANTGHFPMLEQPREFNQRLAEVLETSSRKP